MATTLLHRESDNAVAVHANLAIEGLVQMITDAVKAGDEAQVAKLDGILREVESLVDEARRFSSGRSRN